MPVLWSAGPSLWTEHMMINDERYETGWGAVWETGPLYMLYPEGCGPYSSRVTSASGFSLDRATEKFMQLGKFHSE
jgi:hypothetical protein